MSVKQVAAAATMDAPAATVAVNDLEDRGLVVRTPDPTNRRCKMVSLTDAGRDMVATIDAIDDPAPEMLMGLDDAELKQLQAFDNPRRNSSGVTRRLAALTSLSAARLGGGHIVRCVRRRAEGRRPVL